MDEGLHPVGPRLRGPADADAEQWWAGRAVVTHATAGPRPAVWHTGALGSHWRPQEALHASSLPHRWPESDALSAGVTATHKARMFVDGLYVFGEG